MKKESAYWSTRQKKQVAAARIQQGRDGMTSFVMIDAQSVKNTDTAEDKGFDAGKKVSGIKRHIAVDTQGLPHAIAMTTANVTDRQGALRAFERCHLNLCQVRNVLADGGYTGAAFARATAQTLARVLKLSNAKNCTLPRLFPSVGSWNVPLPGWKSAEDYGKTASESLTPAYR